MKHDNKELKKEIEYVKDKANEFQEHCVKQMNDQIERSLGKSQKCKVLLSFWVYNFI